MILTACVCLAGTAAIGAPVEWPESEGGNGHCYEAVLVPEGITWQQASAQAEAAGGHLVTITSEAENAFVFDLTAEGGFWVPQGGDSDALRGPWVGGVKPDPDAPPAEGWEWVTGEAFSYAAWAPGQPNNAGGDQTRIHYWSNTGTIAPTWQDVKPAPNTPLISYVIEWDAGKAGGFNFTDQLIPTPTYGPFTLGIGDLNGNSCPDVAFAQNKDDKANMATLFDSPVNTDGVAPFGTPSETIGCVVGDVDADGDDDVLTSGADGIRLHRNSGEGEFTEESVETNGPTIPEVLLGDLDGDSSPDLVALWGGTTADGGGGVDNRIAVYLNDGSGLFLFDTFVEVDTQPIRGTLRDFDEDGDLDLAVVNRVDRTVQILHNDGDGNLLVVQSHDVGVNPRSIDSGDIDGDGTIDLVNTNTNDDTLGIMFGVGNGIFAVPQEIAVGEGPMRVRIADLDGLGTDDLAVTIRNEDAIRLLFNWSNGAFSDELSVPTADMPRPVEVADLDSDGDNDVVVGNDAGEALTILWNGGLPCPADLNGDGEYGSIDLNQLLGAFDQTALGDIDGDGDTDSIDLNTLLGVFGTSCCD